MVWMAALVAVMAGMVVPVANAQDGVTLTLNVPEWMAEVFREDALAGFEAQSGIKVQIVNGGAELFFSPAQDGLDAHLEDALNYVSSADVVFVEGNNGISVEATRAGYFLDLAPLTNWDASLKSADFLPAAWQAFQWDQGVWALPASVDVVTMIYDPAAFDAAGIAYPSSAWTIDDLANAARKLATYDADGSVSTPGLMIFDENLGLLFRSLLGQGLYDPNALPNMPALSNPTLETLLDTWKQLEDEGVVGRPGDGVQFNEVPMRILSSFGLNANANETQPAATLLPGGSAGLQAQGFAISAGTLYPEQAYALVKYLTSSAEIANRLFGLQPARQSLVGTRVNEQGDGPRLVLDFSPEAEAALQEALVNALPASEMRFSNYLLLAKEKMTSEGLDARSALQSAEALAVGNLQMAAERRATTTILVATPIPEVVLQPGEIALNFGLASFVMPLPNRDQWEQLIAEFVASDPEVGQINFNTQFGDARSMAETNDCFFLPYNGVTSLDLTTVLNLDPFMDADPTFNRNDVVGGLLAQLQRDNKTWALPISLQPKALRYHSQIFQQTGVPEPTNGWTIDVFNDALRWLKETTGDDTPFVSRDPGASYLLMLIAAYGGIPLDYRTNPPTINFTDPANVEAIRQVLNLAKDGLINYQETTTGAVFAFASGEEQDPIYTDSLSGFNIRRIRGGGGQPSEDPYRLTTYPTGSQYSAASFDLGTAYISATAQNPEACYRWISTIARRQDLFNTMPARLSLINDPVLAAAQGQDAADFYNEFAALLQAPNNLAFPSPFAGDSPANFLVEFWLTRAFDEYVLRDGDLEAELGEAQQYATAFQECVATIPPFDPAAGDRRNYFGQYTDCASRVDSSVAVMFGG